MKPLRMHIYINKDLLLKSLNICKNVYATRSRSRVYTFRLDMSLELTWKRKMSVIFWRGMWTWQSQMCVARVTCTSVESCINEKNVPTHKSHYEHTYYSESKSEKMQFCLDIVILGMRDRVGSVFSENTVTQFTYQLIYFLFNFWHCNTFYAQ